MDDDLLYSEPIGIGSIQHLNDREADVSRKLPLGFPIPEGDDVTAYRERMKAGEYEDKAQAKKTTKRRAAKKATSAKRGIGKR